MLKKTIYILSILALFVHGTSFAQESEKTDSIAHEKPNINYLASPKMYKIENIRVTGLEDTMYEEHEHVVLNFSGLTIGQEIQVPGDDITNIIYRFLKQGLFSDVKIVAEKIVDDKIWLELRLKTHSRISEIIYTGTKKSEREDLEERLGLLKGGQITPNEIDRAKIYIKKYFTEKGFGEIEVDIKEKEDKTKKNHVILNININKKEKIRINNIDIEGNNIISDYKLKRAMKKTNEKGKLVNLFRSTKFITSEYEEDKKKIIEKYNELGYRDAEIISDSVYKHDDKTVNIIIKINEGEKFYISSIKWVGNTIYNSSQLEAILNMHPGDVYNQKKLQEKLIIDEVSVMSHYQNMGYLFSRAFPLETRVEKDSVDLELRIIEGAKASIRKIVIQGNDRLYEDVVRRELRTKPGAIYNKANIMRSLREIAQTGHFDPEHLQPDIVPDEEAGVVDITYPLVSKANDQLELSAGLGGMGFVGKVSVKFTNFSLKNLLNLKSYKGLIPQGEGQTLILSVQANGKMYQSYNFSFIDPWFGGKRPNSLSFNVYYSRIARMNERFMQGIYDNMYNNPYYGGMGMYDPYGGGMYGGGMHGGGMYGGGMYGGSRYGGYNDGASMQEYSFDPDNVMQILGSSVGYSRRLEWPDDYFMLGLEGGYQLYKMKASENSSYNYGMIGGLDGSYNSLSLNLTLTRNSIDHPVYTRRGSEFTLRVSATPPYSAWDGKDYKKMMESSQKGYTDESINNWIEYHKWKLKIRTYTPLTSLEITRIPVIATRIEYGFLGSYNKYKQSPFETFQMGGSGMSGFSGYYGSDIVAMRGYADSSLGANARLYTRLGLELRYPFLLEQSATAYGMLFVEAGNAWNNMRDFKPFDLKRSAGVGARLMLPMVGLVGIDWAYGFDVVRGTRGGSQVHFVLGQEF